MGWTLMETLADSIKQQFFIQAKTKERKKKEKLRA